jgi:hypothetical protein
VLFLDQEEKDAELTVNHKVNLPFSFSNELDNFVICQAHPSYWIPEHPSFMV